MAQRKSSKQTRKTNEAGNAQLFLLLGVVLLAFHFTNSYTIFQIPVPLVVKRSLLFIAALCTLFSFGCVLHLRIYGAIGLKAARRSAREKLDELIKFIQIGEEAVRTFSANEQLRSRMIAGQSNCSLTRLKLFLGAMQRRYIEVNELLATGDRSSVIEAYNILHRRLSTTKDILEMVLTADPLPPVPADQINVVLEELIQETMAEYQVLAA